MCGIIGIFHQQKAFAKMKVALAAMKNRGKDGFGIAGQNYLQHQKKLAGFTPTKEENLIGHALHSIVSFKPQPIKQSGLLVANCEIYNWRELAKKYKFKAKNDAELLLKLLEKKGMDVLEELDG